MQSPEVQSRLAILRAKAADDTITPEELREAVQILRADRRSAAATPSKSSRAKGPVRSADSLLGELDAL